MQPPRSDMGPIIRLLALFFVGTAFALQHSLADAIEMTSPALPLVHDLLLAQAPSCPSHISHRTPRNTTIIGHQPHVEADVVPEPVFAHGTHSDPTPFSSLPVQSPSKPAEHRLTMQFPAPEHRRGASLSIRSRINAAKLSVLEIVPQTKSLRALLPAGLPAGRRDLSAFAASALRLGSSSLHVGAATLALLLLGTIMCTL